MSIEPRNLTAQMQHRAAGNPPSTLPDAAISNCFPGLEFDARNIWRRIFVGIEMHESYGLVTADEVHDPPLVGLLLYRVADVVVVARATGPTDTAPAADLGPVFLERSNALADAVATGGTVECEFRAFGDNGELPESSKRVVALQLRNVFALDGDQEPLPVVAEDLIEPGDLTQSLCSPWQNDYRECGCYYWAASRPDYVNVEPTADGSTTGTNWLARDRSPTGYSRPGQQLFSYDDLFRNWQGLLPFVVDGRDHD